MKRWQGVSRNPLRTTAVVVVGCVMLSTACGTAEKTDGPAAGGGVTLSLVAYSVPEPGWRTIIPAFNGTPEGAGVSVSGSYDASGVQARAVADGKPADIVNLSLEPDVTRLVKAGKVSADWNIGERKGIAFSSLVTLVVRKGNPRGIKDWDDLLQPGLRVVTPDPRTSGSAKWNLLAPYAVKSDGGRDRQAGIDFVDRLITDHVSDRPASGRDATQLFLAGTGDVLLSYEDEALNTERQGEAVEHVTPSQTFKIENPVAVTTTAAHPREATALANFLFTEPAQRLWAQAGFRPVNRSVAAEFEKDFPKPDKLWTIAEIGGWQQIDPDLFDGDNGAITKIYAARVK